LLPIEERGCGSWDVNLGELNAKREYNCEIPFNSVDLRFFWGMKMIARESRNERGFSIVELLVVGAIFGILALIAVPQYSMYRERSYKTAAANDLRNIAAAQESYFAQNAKYYALTTCSNVDALSQCEINGLPGVARLSKGINMQIEAGPSGFKGEARHAKSDLVCRWDSTQGGMLGCTR
jgi:type IV pilus assembly protein PilA